MARNSRTPAHRIEYLSAQTLTGTRAVAMTAGAWHPMYYGRPTNENLATAMAAMNQSMLPGGVNARVAAVILRAQVVDQRTGAVVATFTRGA